MSKKIIVSGCPRSGTSVTSLLIKHGLGEDRFIGGNKKEREPAEGPPREPTPVQKYMTEKRAAATKAKRRHTKKMNPTGFHEMAWTVRGIQYAPQYHNLLYPPEGTPRKAIKIVSQGLAITDPMYVDRVIFCLRNPRNVATSQEDLVGQFGGGGAPEVNGTEIKKHSPEMFVKVTTEAARWFIRNPDVPVIILPFEGTHEDPQGTVDTLAEFIGEGEWEGAADLVRPDLNRSEEKPDDHPLWEAAMAVYEATLKKDWAEVLRVSKAASKHKNLEKKQADKMPCTRMGSMVSIVQCNACRTHKITRSNYKHSSRANWKDEPCLRDVAEGKCTIEESIADNTWDK